MKDKPYPKCGEKWLHPDSGHVVTVWRLCISFWGLTNNLTHKLTPKGGLERFDSSINESQCIIYIGDDNGEYYIRTLENFLERFEKCS